MAPSLLACLMLWAPAASLAANDPAPSVLAPESQPETMLQAPAGYLIGSFTVARGDYPAGARNFHYNKYEFMYRQFDPARKPATGVLNAINEAMGDVPDATRRDEIHGKIGSKGTFLLNKHPHDFSFDEGSGTVFAIALPAGKYEFYQYYLLQNSGNVSSTFEARNEFSIPFEIRPGRATYIGEVRAVNRFERNLLGFRIAAGVRWRVHDAFTRDEPILKAKFPVLDGFPVDREVLSEGFEEGPAD